MALFQLVTFPCLIFLSYKDAPSHRLDRLSPLKWIDIMPYLFYIVALVDFLIIPVCSVAHTALSYREVDDSNFTGLLTFVAFINAVFMVYWTPFLVKMVDELREQGVVKETKHKKQVAAANQDWNEIKASPAGQKI